MPCNSELKLRRLRASFYESKHFGFDAGPERLSPGKAALHSVVINNAPVALGPGRANYAISGW